MDHWKREMQRGTTLFTEETQTYPLPSWRLSVPHLILELLAFVCETIP